jgi:hypothetical protein
VCSNFTQFRHGTLTYITKVGAKKVKLSSWPRNCELYFIDFWKRAIGYGSKVWIWIAIIPHLDSSLVSKLRTIITHTLEANDSLNNPHDRSLSHVSVA